MSGQIKTVGGLYEPEELALAYSEQRDFIAELTREKQRLEASAERYDSLVQALKPLVDASVSGLDDRVEAIEDSLEGSDFVELSAKLEAIEDSLQESDFDELSAKVDDMADAMRRVADAFSDI